MHRLILSGEGDAFSTAKKQNLEDVRTGHDHVRYCKTWLNHGAGLFLPIDEQLQQHPLVEVNLLRKNLRYPAEYLIRLGGAFDIEHRAIAYDVVKAVKGYLISLDCDLLEVFVERASVHLPRN